MGITYALALGNLFTAILKILVGEPRPNFISVCKPLQPLPQGKGFHFRNHHGIYFTQEICTNTNKGALKAALQSFPSGHSCAAFATCIFLAL